MKPFVIIMIALAMQLHPAMLSAADKNYQLPILISGAEPSYPQPRFANNRDLFKATVSSDSGLVEFMFMVDISGKPIEIMKTWSSMQKFEDQALLALQLFRYEPARVKNEAVIGRSSATVEFTFKNNDLRNGRVKTQSFGSSSVHGSLPKGFISFNKKLNTEIQAENVDNEKIDYLLNKMSNLKHQKFYSLAYLSLARFNVAKKRKDSENQILALTQLLKYDYQLDEKYKTVSGEKGLAIKATLIKLLIGSGRYIDAINYYTNLRDESPELESLFSGYIDQIQTLRSSSNVVERKLAIRHDGYIQLNLFKRSFSIDQVIGVLNSIKLRCEQKFLEIEFQPSVQITLPAKWGECNLQVIGDPETSFALLQQ